MESMLFNTILKVKKNHSPWKILPKAEYNSYMHYLNLEILSSTRGKQVYTEECCLLRGKSSAGTNSVSILGLRWPSKVWGNRKVPEIKYLSRGLPLTLSKFLHTSELSSFFTHLNYRDSSRKSRHELGRE